MYEPLAPCPSCTRHVKIAESACPFCSAPLGGLTAPAGAPPGVRLNRAAAFAFGATLALTGCSSSSTDSTTDGGSSDGSATDGSSSGDAAKSDSGPADDGGGQPLYGLPADAGVDTGPPDDGGGQALYGGPPDAAGD